MIKEVLCDHLQKEIGETKCIPFCCGFIDEGLLVPFKRKGAKSSFMKGKKRPFLVVHSDKTNCYLILSSTSPFKFKCKKDSSYGIEEKTPEIVWGDCCRKNEKGLLF